jgi:hypothetical protein
MSAEWGKGRQRPGAGKPYAQEAERRAPVRHVAMHRAPRLYAPEATVHVVARCNNREFYFTSPEDLAAVLGKLRGMVRDYELTLRESSERGRGRLHRLITNSSVVMPTPPRRPHGQGTNRLDTQEFLLAAVAQSRRNVPARPAAEHECGGRTTA